MEAPVAELEALLREASSAYYHGTGPIMTDAAFDALKDQLAEQDPNNSFLLEVGAPVTKMRVTLPYPMMSMDKVKPGSPRLARWLKKYPGPYSLSDKLDGTSCMIVADAAGKVKLFSRGDHRGGHDITHLIAHILPEIHAKRLPNAIAVRGEIVMDKKTFCRRHAGFANPRGLTNGLVNMKTVDNNIAQDTDFVAYEVVSPRLPKSQQWKMLADLGLKVVHHKVVYAISEDDLADLYRGRRQAAAYDIDGIIVEDEGSHDMAAMKNPEYAFAFKMEVHEEGVQTTVVDVEWEASKDSKLIPRVRYQPVTIDGTVLHWATGFNARFISDNMIGPGSAICVMRAGQVIPKIVKVVRHTKPKMPTGVDCSWDSTRTHLVLSEKTVGDQADSIAMKRILRFFALMQIDNMKEGLVSTFYEAGLRSIADYLEATATQFAQMPGVSDVLADKLVSNIQRRIKDVELASVMAASNVFGAGLGEKKMRTLLEEMPDLLDQRQEGLHQRICAIEGFQKATAQKIVGNLPAFQEFLQQHPQITVADSRRIVQQGRLKCAGQNIVFTGFRNKVWEKLIIDNGGTISTTVSPKTTLLIAKDPKVCTGKVGCALKHNIPVVSCATFNGSLSGLQ